jgi:23S rRNA (uracil1939-C5)-methyltransferase
LTAVLTAALARVAAAQNLARLTRHGELVAQQRVPTVAVGKASVPLPPAAFLQATAQGETVLAQLVLAACAGAKTVADLFCGVGPFALRLAEQARVAAIDDDEAAVGALRRAAAAAAGLKPIAAEQRDLLRRPLVAGELNEYEAVVFDPPRQGALAQSRELAASGVPVIVAVSCNAGTFARDMRHLLDGGYRLTAVNPVDQFRYSAHVEIVARLEK